MKKGEILPVLENLQNLSHMTHARSYPEVVEPGPLIQSSSIATLPLKVRKMAWDQEGSSYFLL